MSIPDYDWYCPLCEHKRLCDSLIEKLLILIKDQQELEMKRRLSISKRRKRLTNVTVNVERYVEQSNDKSRKRNIVSSDENDDKETRSINVDDSDDEHKHYNNKNKATSSANDDDDDDDDSVYGFRHNKSKQKKISSTDDDSVYGYKNDENRKLTDQRRENEDEQTGKRRVRSCRKKTQNYSLDDYDKKIKEALIDAGINKEHLAIDSGNSLCRLLDISQYVDKGRRLMNISIVLNRILLIFVKKKFLFKNYRISSYR